MTDLAAAQAGWHDWIRDACSAVGIDAETVDVTAIHALTKDIAHDVARPMAPVGSYILGVAVGGRAASGEQVDVEALCEALRATLSAPRGPGDLGTDDADHGHGEATRPGGDRHGEAG
jgi:Domain of unknown function (DUF6457)